jgi:hypothetical protein
LLDEDEDEDVRFGLMCLRNANSLQANDKGHYDSNGLKDI